MNPAVAPLFTPTTLKGLTLPNRIVMAPMTRSKSPGGIPGPDVAAYYRRRAEGGVGLIITEGTATPHDFAKNDPDVPDFFGADALAGWARVVQEVHAAGGRIMPQIWHVGLRRAPRDPRPEDARAGPSGIAKPGQQVAEPMTEADIADAIASYATAAADAKRLGFDGVEIHGAHGYLIDQFFWDQTNLRSDRWGGGFAARGTFGVAVVKAVRAAVGPDFPIVLRWSQWKGHDFNAKLAGDPEALEQFLRPLIDAGVDCFHCSQRRFWEPEYPDTGSDMNLAGWVQKISGLPAITVGSIGLDTEFTSTWKAGSGVQGDLTKLMAMLTRGDFGLVAVGRALIVNPDWPKLIAEGRTDALVAYDPKALEVLV